jgi:hypothetical protein
MKNCINDYSDPPNLEEIKTHLSTLATLGEVKKYVEEILPGWFIGLLKNYSDDYSHLNSNWQKVCEKIGCEKTEIILVKDLSHEPNYTLISLLAEIFTRAGFSVRRSQEYFPCAICGKALPNLFLWNTMKANNFNVPEVWSEKCMSCK